MTLTTASSSSHYSPNFENFELEKHRLRTFPQSRSTLTGDKHSFLFCHPRPPNTRSSTSAATSEHPRRCSPPVSSAKTGRGRQHTKGDQCPYVPVSSQGIQAHLPVRNITTKDPLNLLKPTHGTASGPSVIPIIAKKQTFGVSKTSAGHIRRPLAIPVTKTCPKSYPGKLRHYNDTPFARLSRKAHILVRIITT